MTSKLLQIFAKAPIPGRVKTRLASKIGDIKACRVYESLLQNTLQNNLSKNWVGELWCSPDASHANFQHLQSKYEIELKSQHSGCLGERMLFALQSGLKCVKKVVLIGTDCPSLTSDYIAAAFEKLNTTDVVLGPAEDGGYILIACRATSLNMFDGVQWSMKQTLQQNLSAIESCGLTYALLPTLWDVDTFNDYKRWLG